MPTKVRWEEGRFEAKVERLYAMGAEKFGDFHGGYLNFGLWESGIKNYLAAAENLVLRVGSLIGLNPGASLLDVACGMGPQDILLHRTFGCPIEALDATWKHIDHVQRRITQAGFDHFIRVRHGTAAALLFEESSFTHVMSIEGPPHFNTREDFFHEAYRVLKPGGVMGLADYSVGKEFLNLWERLLLGTTALVWHVPKPNLDTTRSYRAKLEKAGFRNIAIQEIGPSVIPGYYFEQRRPETIEALRKIRGWFAAYPGSIIDHFLYMIYRAGLVNYILVRAEK